MNITYELTQNEYQEAVALHHKTGIRRLMLAIYTGLALFIILVATDFSNMREVITNILAAFFSIAFYILFSRIIVDHKAKSFYQKSPILSKKITLHISGKGIKRNKQTSNILLPWDMVSKWKKNEKYYLIYTNPRQFNIIPVKAMNEMQIKELDTYLDKYIPQK